MFLVVSFVFPLFLFVLSSSGEPRGQVAGEQGPLGEPVLVPRATGSLEGCRGALTFAMAMQSDMVAAAKTHTLNQQPLHPWQQNIESISSTDLFYKHVWCIVMLISRMHYNTAQPLITYDSMNYGAMIFGTHMPYKPA